MVHQHTVDPQGHTTYQPLLKGHRTAIWTLGVGQPSKVCREDFVRVNKLAVLAFATACKAAGVAHFELLGSVGSDAQSRSFYLRTKGALEEGLQALAFERLSIFHPSMILTPVNRYDWVQGVVLRVWPLMQFALAGPLRKYRGVRSEALGRAMALNTVTAGSGREDLFWDDFMALADKTG